MLKVEKIVQMKKEELCCSGLKEESNPKPLKSSDLKMWDKKKNVRGEVLFQKYFSSNV